MHRNYYNKVFCCNRGFSFSISWELQLQYVALLLGNIDFTNIVLCVSPCLVESVAQHTALLCLVVVCKRRLCVACRCWIAGGAVPFSVPRRGAATRGTAFTDPPSATAIIPAREKQSGVLLRFVAAPLPWAGGSRRPQNKVAGTNTEPQLN